MIYYENNGINTASIPVLVRAVSRKQLLLHCSSEMTTLLGLDNSCVSGIDARSIEGVCVGDIDGVECDARNSARAHLTQAAATTECVAALHAAPTGYRRD